MLWLASRATALNACLLVLVLLPARVKFGAFVEYLQQEHGVSFDRIASGHYARVQRSITKADVHTPFPPQSVAAAAPAAQQASDTVLAAADASANISGSSSSSDSSGSSIGDNSSSNGSSSLYDVAAGDPVTSAVLADRRSSGLQASSSGRGPGSCDASHAAATTGTVPGAGAAEVARLLMVPDAVKDQTYFLASLSPAQLSRCMFPLGAFTKPQVRCSTTAPGAALLQPKPRRPPTHSLCSRV